MKKILHRIPRILVVVGLLLMVGCTPKQDAQDILEVEDILSFLEEAYGVPFDIEDSQQDDTLGIEAYQYILKADDISYTLDFEEGRAILRISGSWLELREKSTLLFDQLCMNDDERQRVESAFDGVESDENIGMSNMFITKAIVSLCRSIDGNIVAIYIDQI